MDISPPTADITAKISISDFYYEIENDETMICNIEVKIEGVEVIDIKEETETSTIEHPSIEPKLKDIESSREEKERNTKPDTRECDADLTLDTTDIDPIKETKEEKEEETSKEEKSVGSLFTSLDSSEETFSTYSIYILRQEETVQSLIEKYHVTKEELENYNDLSKLTIGSKIIIPNTTND